MDSKIQSHDVILVIVLYWPDDNTIAFVGNLIKNGLCVVTVVNGIQPKTMKVLKSFTPFQIIDNKINLGLARALNQGCQCAFEAGASHVLLLDQDSRPSISLASNLLTDFRHLENQGFDVGAVGPRLVDLKSRISSVRSGQLSADGELKFTSVDTLASSGSLISHSAFETVGGMYEWLFIDDIDHEWCFRARGCKLAVLRANTREMLHDMGDHGVTLFGRYRPLHRAPIRHKYIIRNTVFMIRQPYVDWRWRLREAVKTLYRIPVYIIISVDRRSTFSAIISGLMEGLRHKREPKID